MAWDGVRHVDELTFGGRGYAASVALAEKINRYWALRGVRANARVVSEIVAKGASKNWSMHGIRSDLTGRERG